jgi:hypothetical protein
MGCCTSKSPPHVVTNQAKSPSASHAKKLPTGFVVSKPENTAPVKKSSSNNASVVSGTVAEPISAPHIATVLIALNNPSSICDTSFQSSVDYAHCASSDTHSSHNHTTHDTGGHNYCSYDHGNNYSAHDTGGHNYSSYDHGNNYSSYDTGSSNYGGSSDCGGGW